MGERIRPGQNGFNISIQNSLPLLTLLCYSKLKSLFEKSRKLGRQFCGPVLINGWVVWVTS